MAEVGPTAGMLGRLQGGSYTVGASAVVTDVATFDWTNMPAGDNLLLPETGFQAFDYDDGGHTSDSSWHSYNQDGTSVIYSEDHSTHLVYNVGTPGMEIEGLVRLNSPGDEQIAGHIVGLDPAAPLVYVGYELATDLTVKKHVVYVRAGGSETSLFEEDDASLAEGVDYTLRLRLFDDVVTAWFGGEQIMSEPLSAPQIAALGSGTYAGWVNFHGFNNFGATTLRSVT
jgi:hypothetical protein